jgi:hypothetical protein
VGSARRRCQGAESGRGDSGRSAAVFAKLGSTGRFACEAGHVGIAGSRPARSRLARVGWARHTCSSSRADMGFARSVRSSRSSRRVRRRASGTSPDVGIAATARGAGPRGSCAELGRACASRIGASRASTSVGTARRTIQACLPDGAVLEPARPVGVSAVGALLYGLGCTATCGSGATADRRTVVERARSCARVGHAKDRGACRSRGAVMVRAGRSPG